MVIKNRRHDTLSDILHACLLLHTKHPDWRFGQIISNAVREWDGRTDCDPFHITDEAILTGLENLLDGFKQLDNYEKKS